MNTWQISDIHPYTEIAQLNRDFLPDQIARRFPLDLVAALVGMQPSFVCKILGARQKELGLGEVLTLLDQDAFAETFVPRSRIPGYLLSLPPEPTTIPRMNVEQIKHQLVQGNAADLIRTLPEKSTRCVVTSTPYWGMRMYESHFAHPWADGETCPLGCEQTPEGFVRHTVELLYYLKPAITTDGSVWWNLMDTYNTRTQIRTSASETLNAMKGNDQRGWGDHACRRYSAGHSYLKDGEQCLIPSAVATRAGRIGYFVKSMISWKKNGSMPETVESRVTRELEAILHLSVSRTPYFDKASFLSAPENLGGRNPRFEGKKLTDVWHFPTATGRDGHGAQYPVALPGRCIILTSMPGDLVLDPFIGSGTTSVAALLTGRRSLGFDVSSQYLDTAHARTKKALTNSLA